MNKKISVVFGTLGLIGIILVLILIFSGTPIHEGPQEVIKEADIGGDGTQIQYITAPNEANLKVSVTNITKISDTNPAEITVYALKIEGENGQLPENYGNNIINVQNFNNLKTNSFEGNITYDPGVKSFGFVTQNIKAHIIILKRLWTFKITKLL